MSKSFAWCIDKTKLAIWDKHVFRVDEYGTKYWYLNGKCHRKNGPAVEFADWDMEWYLDGKRYSESDYWKELRK